MESTNFDAPHMQNSTFFCHFSRRKFFPLHLVLNNNSIFSLVEEIATSNKKESKSYLMCVCPCIVAYA